MPYFDEAPISHAAWGETLLLRYSLQYRYYLGTVSVLSRYYLGTAVVALVVLLILSPVCPGGPGRNYLFFPFFFSTGGWVK